MGGGTYTHKRSITVNGVNAVNGVNGVNGVNADENLAQQPAQQRLRTPYSVYGEDESVNADRDDKPSDSKENHESVYGVYGVGEERVNADAPPEGDAPPEPEEIAWEWICDLHVGRVDDAPEEIRQAAQQAGYTIDPFMPIAEEAERLGAHLDAREAGR